MCSSRFFSLAYCQVPWLLASGLCVERSARPYLPWRYYSVTGTGMPSGYIELLNMFGNWSPGGTMAPVSSVRFSTFQSFRYVYGAKAGPANPEAGTGKP